MKVNLLYFGRLRDGSADGAAELPDAIADTESLRAWLGRGRPELLDTKVRVALNRQIAPGAAAIAEGDEIAFLPPMSGG